MNRRKRVPDWAILAVCAFISAVLFGTGILNTQKVWNDPKLDWENGTEYTSADGYSVKSAGPYLELPAGKYRLKWKIEGDGENGIHFSCSNDARIVPETVKVIPGQTDGEATIELLDQRERRCAAAACASILRSTGTMRLRFLRFFSCWQDTGSRAGAAG